MLSRAPCYFVWTRFSNPRVGTLLSMTTDFGDAWPRPETALCVTDDVVKDRSMAEILAGGKPKLRSGRFTCDRWYPTSERWTNTCNLMQPDTVKLARNRLAYPICQISIRHVTLTRTGLSQSCHHPVPPAVCPCQYGHSALRSVMAVTMLPDRGLRVIRHQLALVTSWPDPLDWELGRLLVGV